MPTVIIQMQAAQDQAHFTGNGLTAKEEGSRGKKKSRKEEVNR